MGKAIQFSTLQEVMFATSTKPNSTNVMTMQDRVRDNLANDLSEYGIELARLDIETLKVLDEEIAKKLAGQSVIGAEYTTKQATLVKEYDIKTTEAKLLAETENIKVQQRTQAKIAEAQANLDSARKNAEAKIVAAQAEQKAQEFRGELFTKYPILYELEMASIRAKALKNSTIYVTPKHLGGLMSASSMFKSVFSGTEKEKSKKGRRRKQQSSSESDSDDGEDEIANFEAEKERLMGEMKILLEKEKEMQAKKVKLNEQKIAKDIEKKPKVQTAKDS